MRKITITKTIRECATFPEIPMGTPAFIAKGWSNDSWVARRRELEAQGQVYIRLHSSRVGYLHGEWMYLFVPAENTETRI